ncbi:MAG: LamG domain-containing protein [Akkermansiaceae bacterium]|jgi:hypothetical protein|nr:LamG domain-containing protein [Akkermansiaceae bacterium]
MKTFLKILAIVGLAPLPAAAALTTQLVAYWDFEGNALNSSLASGGSAYNGTLIGNASLTGGATRVGSGSLVLDGAGDYLDVTSIVNVNQPWTVSAWYRADLAPGGSTRFMIFESSGNNSFAISFGLREGSPTTNTNHQTFTDNTPGTDQNASFNITDTATANTWYHVALAFTPSTPSSTGSLVTYINGNSTSTLTIPITDSLVVPTGFHIGTYRNADGRWFDGAIDEVAIWNRTLAATEINNANTGVNADSLYQRGLSGLAVPEPSVALLGGLGLLALLGRRQR